MNECVAVLAVCEAPQGRPHSINPVFILDFSLFSCSLDVLAIDPSVPIDQFASAVGTCVRRMHQLKVLFAFAIKPQPVFQALGDRECPLDHLQMVYPRVCTILVWPLKW